MALTSVPRHSATGFDRRLQVARNTLAMGWAALDTLKVEQTKTWQGISVYVN